MGYSKWQIPWLSEQLLQLLFVHGEILHSSAHVVCRNVHKFAVANCSLMQSVTYCLIIFLYIFNSLSTSPNSLGYVRIHCWKHPSSSCCPGAASSQLKPVDFQVSAYMSCVCMCGHVSAVGKVAVRQNTNPVGELLPFSPQASLLNCMR